MLKRTGLVVIGLLCVLALAPATAPIQLSYVYSDSMEPTVGQSDGYVLLSAGDVNSGDIVTFWSAERDSYVTHRVVGRTDSGFLTKGDNNPKTDQAAGDPPVRRGEIIGKVLTVQGEPVVIPGLGHAVRSIHAHRVLLAGLLGIALVTNLLHERSTARPSRSVTRSRDVLWLVFAVAVLSAIGLHFFGGSTEQLTYVAVSSDMSGPNTITVGEPLTESVVINRSTVPLTTEVISADGMSITNRTGNASSTTVSLRIPPPTRTGTVTTKIRINRYATVLPPATIRQLHALHPLVATSTTVGIVMSPLVLVVLLTIDGKRPIRSVESRWRRTLRRQWREL